MKTKRVLIMQGLAITWPVLWIAAIILSTAAIALFVFDPDWNNQCAAQAVPPPTVSATTYPIQSNSTAAAAYAGAFTGRVVSPLQDSAPYHECAVAGMAITAGFAIGLFALITLLWWKLTELTGLKLLFEVPWSGLDDGDASAVGAIESVVRAAAFTFALLVGLLLAVISVEGARHIDLLHWERKKNSPPQKPATRQEPSASNGALVDALNAQTSMQQFAFADGSAKMTTLADRASGLSGEVKELTARIADKAQRTERALDRISQSIDQLRPKRSVDGTGPADGNRADVVAHDPCFVPEFKADSDDLRRLRDKANSDQQRWGLPADGRYRVVKEQSVYFSTRISTLSAGAKAELSRFLTDATVGNLALSIKGSADPQGSRADNEELSRKRALSVATFIAQDQRYPAIVGLTWFGEDAPTQPTEPGSSEPYNRVVRVQILQVCQ